MKFPVAIEHGDEHTATRAIIPDIPGAISMGDTVQEALDNVAEMAGLLLDGISMTGEPLPCTDDSRRHQANPTFDGCEWDVIDIDMAPHQCGKNAEVPCYLTLDAKTAQEAFAAVAAHDVGDFPQAPVWVRVERGRLLIGLAEGRWISCPLWWFPRLRRADESVWRDVELSVLGIHWPVVDEDISVDGLLAGNGDLTVHYGLREHFLSKPTPETVACISGEKGQAQAMSDERCLGVCCNAMGGAVT